MASVDPIQISSGRLRILSICWAAYGLVCLGFGALMVICSDDAAAIAWPIATRLDNPVRLLDIFHVAYTGVVVLSAVCGILGLLAAAALARRNPAGRKLALVAGFLSLSRIPLGITLGVYTLVVLLPANSLQRITD